MIINAKLCYIDFKKLITRIQTPSKSKGSLANFFAKTIKVAISPFVVRKMIHSPSILKRLVFSVAEEYGIAISKLTVDSKVFFKPDTKHSDFIKVSILVDNIDYVTVSKFITETLDSTNEVSHNTTLTEVLRIIKPFIGETMATIPPSAISELFDLLAKEKIVELARNYGIAVSNITLTPIVP
ncbi:MAG: hypothetical protein FWD05_03715 [Oscillospiraceae bacterium]|nr:hypothetical protein [Oscillospiraceae bacterium]